MEFTKYFTTENTVLHETENFIVIPSLGSFVIGYVLVIPKNKILSYSELDVSYYSELSNLSRYLVSHIEKHCGRVVCFEHGPSVPESTLGCGIDYAHLHVVPTDCPVKLTLEKKFSFVKFEIQSNWKQFENKDYLYLNENDQDYFADISGENIVSGLIRKTIAEFENHHHRHDWRQHRFEDNIKKTIELFN